MSFDFGEKGELILNGGDVWDNGYILRFMATGGINSHFYLENRNNGVGPTGYP